MFSSQQTLAFAALAFLATTSNHVQAVDLMFNDTDDFYNETDFMDFNETEMDDLIEYEMDIDCTCDGSVISCSVPADEKACVYEDGDVVCADMPVDAPSPLEDYPLEPDMGKSEDSGAHSAGSVAIAVLAVGAAAVAM